MSKKSAENMLSSTRTANDFQCNPSHHRHSGEKLFNSNFATFITCQVVPQSSLTKSTQLTLHNVGYMLAKLSQQHSSLDGEPDRNIVFFSTRSSGGRTGRIYVISNRQPVCALDNVVGVSSIVVDANTGNLYYAQVSLWSHSVVTVVVGFACQSPFARRVRSVAPLLPHSGHRCRSAPRARLGCA